tara:strand:+ start:100 stop:426 length:327 start_codon:yes stop_codon:yes gene_type:complete
MKLKDILKLNEAPMRRAFPRMRSRAEMEKAGVNVGIDTKYFLGQVEELLTGIEDFHQELGTAVKQKGDSTGNYQYNAMEKQVGRYMSSVEKSLNDLQKYLERQKRKGL